MNKKKILELVEKDFFTIANLERSMKYMLNSGNRKQYQHKVLHAAFRRTCDILLKRRKYIAKELGLELQLLVDPNV
ncbi:MAG: hypothetical protein KAK00_03670 [Nanoarchaeota archaeon]|nr:hypothetical protein [Nanoarchaeota archaeon]